MINPIAQHAQTHAEVAERTFKTLHARYRDPKKVWGYSWGFDKLNELTGGIQWEGTKELTVVGARSNVGKSAFGMRVALEVAQQFKKEFPGLEVRIILLEMTPDACYQRLIGQIAGVSLTRLRSGFMEPYEWQQVERAKVALDGLPITYLSGSYHVDSIKQFVAGDLGTGRSCGYWLLDHIGIVPTEAARNANQSFSLGEISRGLLTVARRYAPGMVLAQLNRESVKRKDPTPNAADTTGYRRSLTARQARATR
jgi:replicative DNA helicase